MIFFCSFFDRPDQPRSSLVPLLQSPPDFVRRRPAAYQLKTIPSLSSHCFELIHSRTLTYKIRRTLKQRNHQGFRLIRSVKKYQIKNSDKLMLLLLWFFLFFLTDLINLDPRWFHCFKVLRILYVDVRLRINSKQCLDELGIRIY